MRISVVVIVYNLDTYIDQAIESVLEQTRQADEIIVVDDCSTDRSAERVKAYGHRLHYLRMPTNSGALLAALQGVKAATGDVVCMLDGDDYWATNKLETVERQFTANPNLGLLSHEHVRVDERGTDLGVRDDTHRNIEDVRRRANSTGELSALLRDSILAQKGYWLGSAYSFRRKVLDVDKFERQVGTFGFDRLRQTYLDLVVAPFIVLTNPQGAIGYTPDTQFYYRIHDSGSLAGNVTPEKARESALKGRTINELIQLVLKENNADAAYLQRRERILLEYDFLCALYSGENATAARLYMQLAATHWSREQLRKETKRFVAVMTLGPQRFLELGQMLR